MISRKRNFLHHFLICEKIGKYRIACLIILQDRYGKQFSTPKQSFKYERKKKRTWAEQSVIPVVTASL